jgi:phosphotransferase system enzyme I (PtsI)
MESSNEVILKGIAASPGVSEGRAFIYLHRDPRIPSYEVKDIAAEIDRFERSLIQTREQIVVVRNDVAEKLGESEAQIFDAHQLVLEDQALIEETIAEIRETEQNIEACFNRVANRYIGFFEDQEDPYLKERASDIKDVTKRVLRNLLGITGHGTASMEQASIICSEDLNPSDTAGVSKDKVLGFLTDYGGRTSHSVILARAIQVPAIVGLQDATKKIKNGDNLLIDGFEGLVIINPSEQTRYRYGQIRKERDYFYQIFSTYIPKPAVTKDGVIIEVKANVEGVKDIDAVQHYGASGIGLYRTEAMFIKADNFPSEEEQYKEYEAVAKGVAPKPVVIRTLDLGGDKVLSKEFFRTKEDNPFMGFRAIRFCLKHTKVFKDQLRAILRASYETDVQIMYPMISGLRELIQANDHLEEAKQELRQRDIPFNENIKVGCMVETPAAAMIIDLLSAHCDFFSIGSNDLTQYMLAVDRVNNQIAYLYEPSHPAMIRTVDHIFSQGIKLKRPVSICGEIAGDPIYTALLVGMGCRELSGTPATLPEIKYIISQISIRDAKKLRDRVIKKKRSHEILNEIREFHTSLIGELKLKK